MKYQTTLFLLAMALGGELTAQTTNFKQPKMEKVTLEDDGQPFETMLIKADAPSRIVLFSVGSGGNPERHLPLLVSLAEQGATIVAPYFDRLAAPRPTEGELQTRAGRLRISLDSVAGNHLPIMGIGHSIGATLLIALSRGQLWLGPGRQIPIDGDMPFNRLVVMTPPTGFFQAPGALDTFNIPIQAWAGSKDQITPPTNVEFLKQVLGDRVPVEIRIEEGAGHFTFMNTLPPQVVDPHPDRSDFLSRLATEIQRYLTAD